MNANKIGIYKFHYSFEDTFRDWFEACDKEALF